MKIAFIGCGNMGEAILAGTASQHSCVVCEARAERRSYLKKKYRCTFVDTAAKAVSGAEVVLLAVKPQDLAPALADIRPVCGKQLFISIAAGITAAFIEKSLGGKARVVRTMPNLPAMIGEGVTAVSSGKYATPGDLKAARKILAAVGAVIVVPEKMINAVTAVSGSGPAYVFLFVECLMNAARKLGFNDQESKTLVYQTLSGSARMLAGSADSAEVLRQKVTSKGGTTQAAIGVLQEKDISGMFLSAVKAAHSRAKQLAQ
ncbi:MAG: pyrroline-5-carboxylate reductase [Candidatus Omnitrophica bacterium]|nr:pyrroline-5-carboxylate reductase [Candidatus Omnitrophota bacterium]